MAQSQTVKFYTDHGKKEISEVKCADISDLSYKVNIPANAAQYDRIQITISTYLPVCWNNSYLTKDDCKKLAGKTHTVTVFDPENDKVTIAGNPEFCKQLRINKNLFCTTSDDMQFRSSWIDVKLYGQKIVEKREYREEGSNIIKIIDVYNEGDELATGRLTFQLIVTDSKEVVKITPFDQAGTLFYLNKSASYYNYEAQSKFELYYQLISMKFIGSKKITNELIDNAIGAKILIIDGKNLEGYFQNIIKRIPSYTSYNYVLDDIEAIIMDKSGKEPKLIKIQHFSGFQWIDKFLGFTCNYFPEFEGGKANNPVMSKKVDKNENTIWQKKKVGNYEYDYLKMTKAYHAAYNQKNVPSFNEQEPVDIEIYAIYRAPYIVLIHSRSEVKGQPHIGVDKAKQSEMLLKTVQCIEYLK
jgi:hypothetical protein